MAGVGEDYKEALGPFAYGPFTKTRTVPESFWTSPLEAAAVMVSAVLVTEFLLRATRLGIAVEALGSAPKAAKTYGVGVRSTLLAVSAYQGALAGLGGFMMATGFYHSLMSLNQPSRQAKLWSSTRVRWCWVGG